MGNLESGFLKTKVTIPVSGVKQLHASEKYRRAVTECETREGVMVVRPSLRPGEPPRNLATQLPGPQARLQLLCHAGCRGGAGALGE